MTKEELIKIFSDIANAAGNITGGIQSHRIAAAIMQDCETAVKKLMEDIKDERNFANHD